MPPAILVAEDLAIESGRNLRSKAVKAWASSLAFRLGKSIDLAYAIDLSLYDWRTAEYKSYLENFVAAQKARLAAIAETMKVPTRPLVIDADPVKKLISLSAKTGSYELLALGTHGRKGLGRLFLGSVAEEVIRHSSIPVMTVGPNAQKITRAPLSNGPLRLLVPTGLTPNTDRAIQYAASLAERTGGELILFHSLQESLHPVLQTAFTVPGAAADLRGLMDNLERAAMRQLSAKTKTLRKSGIRVTVALEKKSFSASEAILKEAARSDATLVVLGTHGRSTLAGAFFGRTARDVILKATVPVITVRSRSA